MSYKGDALIAVGVAVILIAMLLGYELYVGAQRSMVLGSQQQGANGGINASSDNLIAGLNGTVSTSAYYIIEILVLFLFANIGYKIALIGTKINKEETPPDARRQAKAQRQDG